MMKNLLCLSLASALIAVSCGTAPRNTTPDGLLVRAEDPAATFDPSAVAAFKAAADADSIEVHSVMVMHHGQVVAEQWWGEGAPETPHIMNSVSKSFTATAVGFAIAEGLISLDDKVVSFFPEKVPAEASPNLGVMTIRNLLTMSTGQVGEPQRRGQQDWIAAFMNAPVDDAPGATFRYNSMATFMLSAIVQKVSGQKITEYLRSRLFEPLAIDGYRWDESPDGINAGGWGLYIKTEDMAKFGQLFLQDGVWNGVRVLPEGWVAEASKSWIESGPAGNEHNRAPDNEWSQGYGYQMWRCTPAGVYRADGARGQFIFIIPDRDAVIAVTSNTNNMPGEIALVWKHLLPGLK
ncbi:MAG: beta-lactamase family protein [Alistipes sp.]|jgi:CubicO group peptidase (beta-lactamase class C family)|nr:beta-lactamase family protein [Alistipes sp.]